MFESVLMRWRLSQLLKDWMEFRMLWERYRGVEDIPAETEQRFLRLKAVIASRLSLLKTKAPRAVLQEANTHHQGITEFLGTYLELTAKEPPTEEERERFVRRWQKHYLFLNELKGLPPGGEKQHRAPRFAPAPRPAPTGIPIFRNRLHGGGVFHGIRLLLGGAMLLFVGYLIVVVLGSRFHWSWVGVEQYGARSRAVWDEVPQRAASFLAPVTAHYGVETTTALLGILLLSAGYWVFVRQR